VVEGIGGMMPDDKLKQELLRRQLPPKVLDEAQQGFRGAIAGKNLGSTPDEWSGKKAMLPLPPAMFIPDPLISGTPEFSRWAKQLLDLDSQTKDGITGIHMKPNRAIDAVLGEAAFSVEDWPRTGLLGVYDRINHDIAVNPRLAKPNEREDPAYVRQLMLDTLVHELSHAAGHDEETADKIGNEAAKHLPERK
jgi:hypothetical protein